MANEGFSTERRYDWKYQRNGFQLYLKCDLSAQEENWKVIHGSSKHWIKPNAFWYLVSQHDCSSCSNIYSPILCSPKINACFFFDTFADKKLLLCHYIRVERLPESLCTSASRHPVLANKSLQSFSVPSRLRSTSFSIYHSCFASTSTSKGVSFAFCLDQPKTLVVLDGMFQLWPVWGKALIQRQVLERISATDVRQEIQGCSKACWSLTQSGG